MLLQTVFRYQKDFEWEWFYCYSRIASCNNRKYLFEWQIPSIIGNNETYFECEPDELMNGSELSKCYQLAQRLLFIVENANDHYASYPEAHVLFLYYDYDGFDREVLDFPSVIKKPYKNQFKILSYQALFEELQNSFLNVERHKEWFEYMDRRYFS